MEAAGGSAGRDPERAIEVASLERAREVQQRLGLDADNDLAFAFESYADAMAAGGRPLASQWAVARGQAEASLSQAGAPAADDSGLGSPRDLFPKPLLRPRPLRHQEISLAANRYEPAAVLQRVEALLQCLVEMAVQRPPRDCTEELMVEWRKQLRRLAQQHVTQMDSQIIINAIRTWKELAHFQEDRGLELGESWDFPLFVLEGIDSPMRAIKSLQWLNDAGAMPPNTRTRKRQQAVVIGRV